MRHRPQGSPHCPRRWSRPGRGQSGSRAHTAHNPSARSQGHRPPRPDVLRVTLSSRATHPKLTKQEGSCGHHTDLHSSATRRAGYPPPGRITGGDVRKPGDPGQQVTKSSRSSRQGLSAPSPRSATEPWAPSPEVTAWPSPHTRDTGLALSGRWAPAGTQRSSPRCWSPGCHGRDGRGREEGLPPQAPPWKGWSPRPEEETQAEPRGRRVQRTGQSSREGRARGNRREGDTRPGSQAGVRSGWRRELAARSQHAWATRGRRSAGKEEPRTPI